MVPGSHVFDTRLVSARPYTLVIRYKILCYLNYNPMYVLNLGLILFYMAVAAQIYRKCISK